MSIDWKARAKRLKAEIPAVTAALRHPGTPWHAKALAAVTVAYALSPIDLIPDFIPVLGLLDDLLLLPALCALTLRLIPQAVPAACRAEQAARPQKRWACAIPIVIIWLLLLGWVIRLLVQ